MATTASVPYLSVTPLRDWPAHALMAEAKRTARLWRNNPAFSQSNGGLFSNHEDLSCEIAARVLDYLHKKPANDGIEQVTFFHQIARYCQPGIIQDNYSIPSLTEGIEDQDGDEADYARREIMDTDTAMREGEDAERKEKLLSLLCKIGVGERDFALFDTSTADWIDATGLSERENRVMKTKRKKEIVEKIKLMNLGDDLARLMPVLRNSIRAQV
ncbi:hypothetical protein [Thiomonas sp.]